ncbi:C-type mannose receptor 2 isoform X2 [Magallana gigas]|uniref:C-type mannose receptor 2 isoform X2 n=1 Tax=Magallana gigas TaxID=29159 RepID=UPI00333F3B9C
MSNMKILGSIFFAAYISTFLCKAFATTYYCKDKETISIEGESTGIIHTIALGAGSYGNNVDCSWKINAGDGNQLHMKILSSNLEYTPPYTSCFTRDSLFILEGETSSSEVLVSLCGYFNPFEVTSKGQHVYLRFSTNDKNFYDYSGIRLQFQTFGNTSCPPEWRELPVSPMECYKIMTNPTDGLIWSTAQEYCGYSMSNLIVIPTEAIFTMIQAYAVNVSVEKFWIGLNDIETENTIEWIDDTTLYPNDKLQTSSISETNDCVIQDTTKAKWEFRHCTREKFPFVCQRKKVGETKFFRIPEAVDKDKKNGSHQFPWAVSLGAGGAALIIILILVFCVRKVQISRNNNYLPGQGEVDRLTLENTERNRLANQQRASNSKETGFSNSPPSYDDHMGNTRPSLY